MICQWREINYWLTQIIDLRAESRYFAITEFNNCLIIQSLSLFLIICEAICHFHARAIARRRTFKHEQNIICSQQSWMTLRMSRPLFVSSYLQVTWWTLGQWKGKKLHRMIMSITSPCIMSSQWTVPLNEMAITFRLLKAFPSSPGGHFFIRPIIFLFDYLISFMVQ